jgi:hypothetical protein
VAVHGFLLFIVVNGAIVFEAGVTRWAGILVVLALASLAVWRAFKRRSAVKVLPSRERIHEADGEVRMECRPGVDCGGTSG